MIVTADQPKKVVDRKVVAKHEDTAFEVVRFKTNSGPAWGYLEKNQYGSSASELYDSEKEIMELINKSLAIIKGDEHDKKNST